MNKTFLIAFAANLLDSLSIFFASKDANNTGQDDRIARILTTAANELREYLAEETEKLPV